MALTAVEFEVLLFMMAGLILHGFELLDSFVIVHYPLRDVSFLDFLIAFSILAVISDFIYHTFHVGGGGSGASGQLYDVSEDADSVPVSEYISDYIDDLEDLE